MACKRSAVRSRLAPPPFAMASRGAAGQGPTVAKPAAWRRPHGEDGPRQSLCATATWCERRKIITRSGQKRNIRLISYEQVYDSSTSLSTWGGIHRTTCAPAEASKAQRRPKPRRRRPRSGLGGSRPDIAQFSDENEAVALNK